MSMSPRARKKRSFKTLAELYAILIYAVFYIPVVVMMVFSFNDQRNNYYWAGFTTKWYGELFNNHALTDSLWYSVVIAVLATLISVTIGTIGALGIQNLMRADMGSQRNVLIVGFAFLMALGLPGWVEPHQAMFTGALGSTFGGMIWAVMKTPMAVAGVLALICDNIIPGTKEERGIKE